MTACRDTKGEANAWAVLAAQRVLNKPASTGNQAHLELLFQPVAAGPWHFVVDLLEVDF